jgi:hypothetical protein
MLEPKDQKEINEFEARIDSKNGLVIRFKTEN